MTNKISIEGPIKIETKEEKTSLIKRSKDKLPECSKNKDKSKDNLRYSLHWDYTTNKSGKQQFTFTGKEMGDNFWSPGEKTKLKVGDLIIYKKKGHPNFNYKILDYLESLTLAQLIDEQKDRKGVQSIYFAPSKTNLNRSKLEAI